MKYITLYVIYPDMSEPPLPPRLRAYALNFVARLAPMLRALALLAGYRFARNPILAPFLVPLQTRLHRTIRRLARLMQSLAAGETQRPARPRAPRPARPRPRFPSGQGWLIRALPGEAVAFTTGLAALLAEPEIAEILAHCRRARRLLAPVQHALSGAQPRGKPLRSLIPLHPVPDTGSPPTAIPPFLLYPTPIPPKITAQSLMTFGGDAKKSESSDQTKS